MPDGVFTWTHRVAYAECTVGNHVYYARYLEWLEIARGEFFRSLNRSFLEWQQAGTIFPVVEIHLGYKAPARYDDLLSIQVWISELGNVRLNFAYVVRDQTGRVLLEGETWHVCAGLEERPKRLPQELTESLRPFLLAAPRSPPAGAVPARNT
jgi:acyl-CoA thioester hydrolase